MFFSVWSLLVCPPGHTDSDIRALMFLGRFLWDYCQFACHILSLHVPYRPAAICQRFSCLLTVILDLQILLTKASCHLALGIVSLACVWEEDNPFCYLVYHLSKRDSHTSHATAQFNPSYLEYISVEVGSNPIEEENAGWLLAKQVRILFFGYLLETFFHRGLCGFNCPILPGLELAIAGKPYPRTLLCIFVLAELLSIPLLRFSHCFSLTLLLAFRGKRRPDP